MDETYFTLYPDHFNGVLAHVKIENRAGIGQDVPEGTRNFDNGVGAFVVDPGHTRSHIHLGQVGIEGDELDLGAVPDPEYLRCLAGFDLV